MLAHLAVSVGRTIFLRRLDDEAVAYDDLTGETHLLSVEATAVVAALAAGPMSSAEVAIRVAEVSGTAGRPDISALLSHLAGLGLVEVVG